MVPWPSYRTLAPRPGNDRVLGELTLPLPGCDAKVSVLDSSGHHESFHLIYAGDTGVMFSRDHRLVDVDVVRSNGARALAGCYLVDMLQRGRLFSTEERIVENGRQLIPLAGVADLEPGALIATSIVHCYECLLRLSCPTLQLLLHFLVTLL